MWNLYYLIFKGTKVLFNTNRNYGWWTQLKSKSLIGKHTNFYLSASKHWYCKITHQKPQTVLVNSLTSIKGNYEWHRFFFQHRNLRLTLTADRVFTYQCKDLEKQPATYQQCYVTIQQGVMVSYPIKCIHTNCYLAKE